MDVPAAMPLFAWPCLEDSPALDTLGQFLRSIPDGELLEALRKHRRNGRNDYPVEVCWGVLLLTVALRQTQIRACLEELARNVHLRLLIGIESVDDIPKNHNMSRFLKKLGRPEFVDLLSEVFDAMVRRLGQAVADLGEQTAGDATALCARRDRAKPFPGLPQPTGGRKEYIDKDGRVTAAYEWFGYKVHLLVDTRHEVALAYKVTDTKAGDGQTLPALLDQAEKNLPKDRIDTVAYDRAADTEDVHADLAKRGIRPLIETRNLWKSEPLRPVPRTDHLPVKIMHNEQGTVHCTDHAATPPIHRRMLYWGHEKARGTLKYRCPAAQQNWPCGCEHECFKGRASGLIVRVDRSLDPRRFPPIPRATKTFERRYKDRTAVERVNGRLKLYWGLDDGNVTGAGRFHAMIGVVMLVHLGFATVLAEAPRQPDGFGYVGIGPVQKALDESARSD